MIIKHHMIFIHFENQERTGLGAREGIVLGTCKMAGGENQDYLALTQCCHTFGFVLPHTIAATCLIHHLVC